MAEVTQPSSFSNWLDEKLPGKSDAEIAREVGVTPSTVLRWRRGNTPRAGCLLRLAQITGVSITAVANAACISRPPPSPRRAARLRGDLGASGVRLSLKLSTEAVAPLRDYSDRRGVTTTEAIRRAIALLDYVERVQRRGASLAVVEPDGRTVELVLLG